VASGLRTGCSTAKRTTHLVSSSDFGPLYKPNLLCVYYANTVTSATPISNLNTLLPITNSEVLSLEVNPQEPHHRAASTPQPPQTYATTPDSPGTAKGNPSTTAEKWLRFSPPSDARSCKRYSFFQICIQEETKEVAYSRENFAKFPTRMNIVPQTSFSVHYNISHVAQGCRPHW
jgi:hypothetical protein